MFESYVNTVSDFESSVGNIIAETLETNWIINTFYLGVFPEN